MKTDRELLELAAKAIGLTLQYNYLGGRDANQPWDPLTDDGDALRLAVKLGQRIETPKYKGFGSSCGNQTVFQDGCPYAQTRRAIVRAAAAIGEAMP